MMLLSCDPLTALTFSTMFVRYAGNSAVICSSCALKTMNAATVVPIALTRTRDAEAACGNPRTDSRVTI
jgi:hypothetical protein